MKFLQERLEACFSFRYSSGCPFVGSPCWCRLWTSIKGICVMIYYGSMALNLEVEAYVRKGTYIIM